MNRSFDGIKSLYGEEGLKKIKAAHILIIGIGGVGSWAAESLVRSGITKLTLVDMDEICVSNINRQLHALSNNIGRPKVQTMKERLLLINPEVKITSIFDFFTKSNAEETLSLDKYSYIIDAIDSRKNKSVLIGEAYRKSIPLLTIGGAGGKVDPTKIHIRDLNKTINDKFLKAVRRDLKQKYPEFKKLNHRPYNIPAISSFETIKYDGEKKCEIEEIRDCTTGYGSTSFVTASFGFTAAAKVINDITGFLSDEDKLNDAGMKK